MRTRLSRPHSAERRLHSVEMGGGGPVRPLPTVTPTTILGLTELVVADDSSRSTVASSAPCPDLGLGFSDCLRDCVLSSNDAVSSSSS